MPRIFLLLSALVVFAGCNSDKNSNGDNGNAIYTIDKLKGNAVYQNCAVLTRQLNTTVWETQKKENLIRLNTNETDQWFRFHIKNFALQERELYLILKWITLDFAEFCSPPHAYGLETQISGIETPFEKWSVGASFPSFRFWLAPQKESVFYLHIKSEIPVSISYKMLPLDSFLQISRKITSIIFLFYGFGLFYLLYILFLYFESRESIYLYLNFFLIFTILTVMSRFGTAYEFMWGHYPDWEKKSLYFFLGLSTFGGIEFSRKFLMIHKYYKKMNLGFHILSSIAIFYSVVALVHLPRIYLSKFFAGFFVLFVSFIFTSALLVYIQKRYEPARWFLAAIPYYLIVAVLNFIFHLDYWEYDRYWIYAFMLFMPVSFIFLSLSLQEKLAAMKRIHKMHSEEIQNLLEKLRIYTETKPKYTKTQLEGLDKEKEVDKLIALIENEKVFYDEGLDLKMLAEKMNLTRHQVSEILNNVLGTNFHQFIREYRIREAQMLIQTQKNMNILNIAYEVGFQSKSTFNAAFKKITGLTPMEYKNQVNPTPPHQQ